MPADMIPQIEIQQLPADTAPDKLISVLNNRFQQLQLKLNSDLVRKVSPEDVDIGNHRVVNVGDPRDDLDAVNYRTFKSKAAPQATQITSTISGCGYYAIVFTKDGFVADAEETPLYAVDEGRVATPNSALVTAKTAPATQSLKVNWKVKKPGELTFSDLLTLPLEIAVGATGPVFSTGIDLSGEWPKGTVAYMVVVQAGDAQQVVGQVQMQL